jgi:hypothetical protein
MIFMAFMLQQRNEFLYLTLISRASLLCSHSILSVRREEEGNIIFAATKIYAARRAATVADADVHFFLLINTVQKSVLQYKRAENPFSLCCHYLMGKHRFSVLCAHRIEQHTKA